MFGWSFDGRLVGDWRTGFTDLIVVLRGARVEVEAVVVRFVGGDVIQVDGILVLSVGTSFGFLRIPEPSFGLLRIACCVDVSSLSPNRESNEVFWSGWVLLDAENVKKGSFMPFNRRVLVKNYLRD